MTLEFQILLIILMAVMAFLYASVGHGGASGYLALMAIFSISPPLIKSSALILNIFVSFTAFLQFYRGGYFRWKFFLPFALGSVPMSFIGAMLPISDSFYKKLLAVALLIAIARMLFNPSAKNITKNASILGSLIIGASIGLLSGMLGIGGGIILTPVILLLNWANFKETAAVSALFIFVNSISGLIGLLSKGFTPNPQIWFWLVAAFTGGLFGAYFGSRKFNLPTLRYILAVVLLVACFKLMIT